MDKVADKARFTFIDLFAGIGGFHLAMHKLGGRCVFASEIDVHARKTYEYNFRNLSPAIFEKGCFNCDIRNISPNEIPDFDLLCAGFPCQPFSQAGYKRGFNDHHKSERILGKSESGFIISIHGKTQMNEILKCHLQWFRKNATSTV